MGDWALVVVGGALASLLAGLIHRVVTDLAQPALVGYRRTLFWQDWWHMVDIDAPTRTP